jgi:hypothetical protein
MLLREAEGRFVGPPFLWVLSFGGAKERSSSAGTRPGMLVEPSNLIVCVIFSRIKNIINSDEASMLTCMHKSASQHASQQAVSQETEPLFHCVAHSLRLIFITPEFSASL